MRAARSPSIQEILALLPAMEELDGLRLTLCEAAIPDPAQEWARAGRFATVDRRVVSEGSLEEALAAAERARTAQVESLFAAIRATLDAHLAGDEAAAARALLEHGERLEAEDEPLRAR
ncbi:MAG TPA: hypothetical protein VFI96_01320, partial [Longimicrobiaceae bacterium]|nr:hypothetical protein [Longimicrobiaceae bacterium]